MRGKHGRKALEAEGGALAVDDLRGKRVLEFMQPDGVPHFVRKASALLDLTEEEREGMLANLGNTVEVSAGRIVRRAGEPVERVLILVSGAMVETILGRDGRAQNFRFYFPGDTIGGDEVAAQHHAHDIRTLTAASYAWVDKRATPAAGNTRLARLFLAVRLAEQAILTDRLRVIGRERADHRVLHLLLELHSRQRLTEPSIGNRVWRPFSQNDVGDALGLTNVYVSKTLGKLRHEGTLSVDGNVVTLREPGRIAGRIGFVDRYADIDRALIVGDDLLIAAE